MSNIVIAVSRVHYGKDYLPYTIRSTEGFADKHIVLYTHSPSFKPGAAYDDNPDSREEMMEAAVGAGGRRVEWVENQPIDALSALRLYPQAEMLLELDADEVLSPALSRAIIDEWSDGNLTHSSYRVPMVHHWRSFAYICRDSNHPVRLYLPNNRADEQPQYLPLEMGLIHHFGYARRLADMRYKMKLSMHSDEFRPGWWDDIFLKFPERLTDLHPVCLEGFWNAERIDIDTLPRVLANHPYRDLEVIE